MRKQKIASEIVNEVEDMHVTINRFIVFAIPKWITIYVRKRVTLIHYFDTVVHLRQFKQIIFLFFQLIWVRLCCPVWCAAAVDVKCVILFPLALCVCMLMQSISRSLLYSINLIYRIVQLKHRKSRKRAIRQQRKIVGGEFEKQSIIFIQLREIRKLSSELCNKKCIEWQYNF